MFFKRILLFHSDLCTNLSISKFLFTVFVKEVFVLVLLTLSDMDSSVRCT